MKGEIEDDINGRQPQWNMASIDDDLKNKKLDFSATIGWILNCVEA
jgi:hypothetical protein